MPARDECALRPAEGRDAETILSWRNSERIRSLMYTDHLISPEEHRAWFERVLAQRPPLFLVFEVAGVATGVVSVTDRDERHGRCHWGFYVGDPAAPKGSGAALGFLGLSYVFDTLGVRKLVGEALASNGGSVRFHRRLGFREEGRLVRHVVKEGREEDVLRFALFADDWRAAKEGLAAACFTPSGRER